MNKYNGIADYICGEIRELQNTIDDLVKSLEEFMPTTNETYYRRLMKDAPCHLNLCSIDECGHCVRELKVIKAINRAKGLNNVLPKV